MWRRIFIFSIVAFILVTFFTSFNMYWADQIQAKSFVDNKEQKIDLASGLKKINSLVSAMDTTKPASGSKISVQVSDQEITAVLIHILSQLSDPVIAADSFNLIISDNSVISIRGIIVRPIHAPFELNIVASQHEGKVYFDVYNANVAGLPLGTGVFDRVLSTTFGDKWRTFLNQETIDWDDMVVGGGKIYIGGHFK